MQLVKHGVRRILQKTPLQNEMEKTYNLSLLSREDAKSFLSAPYAGGGIFGVEGVFSKEDQHFHFFAPPMTKVHWEEEERCEVFNHLEEHKKDMTCAYVIPKKESCFPMNMRETQSFWKQLCDQCTSDYQIIYQIVAVMRQDPWKDDVEEQYWDYIDGIENPSSNRTIRSIQRKVSSQFDQLLQWTYHHHEIEEIEQKLQENGFRYNIRVAFIGGTSKGRRKQLKILQQSLQHMDYTNSWTMTKTSTMDTIEKIKQRKLSNINRDHVASTSELLPFFMSEGVAHIQAAPVGEKIKIKAKNVPAFDVLPKGQSLASLDNQRFAEKFSIALQNLKFTTSEIVVERIQNGPTMMKMTFKLPDKVKLSDLTSNRSLKDIQNQMGVKNLQITQGYDVGEVDVILPQVERQKIFLRDFVDTPAFAEYMAKYPLPFFVGVDEVGNPIFRCLSKIRHILVAGTTGSGKSVWVNQLILTLLLIRKPEELQFYMIDVKQVELPIYEDFPHVQDVITDAKEAIQMLKKLIAEMDRRYAMFKEHQVKNIALFNKKCPDQKMPYIVCVIDEYAELSQRDANVHELVQSISQLARACGIHLIVATQKPLATVIPTLIRDNMPGKIGFNMSSGGYLTIFNSKPPFNSLGAGDGAMSFEGQLEEHIRFQGCLIIDDPNNDDLEGDLIREIAEEMDDYEGVELPEVKEVEEVPEEKEIDKLKRIIADTGEVRVGKLRDHMRININRLGDLMNELVEEGWLEKPETKQAGWKLIVEEEELKKWKSKEEEEA